MQSTTTSEPMQHPATVYVWVWLPDADEPVVAGRLDDHGSGAVTFAYGRSYLANPDAIALYLPDLPLRSGEIAPTSGTLPGCIADAAPDAWGRRVIEYRLRASDTDLSELAYLLESGSDRAGALDFQASATEYTPRSGEGADLGQLAEAAQRVEDGQPLPPALERALLHGTSIGGARPKVALRDQRTGVIAKFTSSRDTYPVVKAEYIAMELARRAGIDTARVEFAAAAGRDVLLVRRFDRSPPRKRRMMISALTILDLHDAHGIAGRYATYAALADSIRARFGSPDATLRELFSRIVFNILVSNTDDHAKNHSAFWNGRELTLTPAYDICPQQRTGGEAHQAMAYGPNGERLSQAARCAEHAHIYHLDSHDAQAIIDSHIDTITEHWQDVCDAAQLSQADRERLWGRQFLNPFALHP
ncbi:type II toxin-antitoxin system HipA family toxin [Candidatus Poriferisodalis sp.]|uniref:type II toxin-antitoxin system HipA family toxin n=1 Tax=Candidatus Poriferisodalis sp. TaxID=3101277 RepID=UPI003B5C2674